MKAAVYKAFGQGWGIEYLTLKAVDAGQVHAKVATYRAALAYLALCGVPVFVGMAKRVSHDTM